MWGVIAGAALGVLAAKKSGPLVESAMLKYVASRAKGVTDQVDMLEYVEYVASRAKGGTDQVDVPSTDQAAAAPR
jgi:hypothetical protein